MNLTIDQLRAVREGEPVRISDPEIGPECVLLRADVYARVKCLIDNDSEFGAQEASSTINEIMRDDDLQDPWLESYQQP
jgi:hypothetical protein